MLLIPILLPMVLSPVVYTVGKKNTKIRDWLIIAVCAAVFAFALLLWGEDAHLAMDSICGLGLSFHADGFRSVYAAVAAFMWLIAFCFSPEYFHGHHVTRPRFDLFSLLTLGATEGVLLSDDLFTTFVFFEVMSMASYVWVAQEETTDALKAADIYLAVAVIGGLTTLMGLFLLYHAVGSLGFSELKTAFTQMEDIPMQLRVASWLTLLGFAAKAGLYPLHIWLPKAHPVAPAPASALLSGILTKSGIFGILVIASRIRMGDARFAMPLMFFAAITMFLGALLALFSTNLKRTLACSSMSQLGFITLGISFMVLLGEEGSLAFYGVVGHMVNHSLIKLCLFLCAGAAYMNAHTLDLNQLRGWGRRKPLFHLCFLCGALALGCIPPLGSGYHSKSLLHEGMLEYIHHLNTIGESALLMRGLEWLFLLSGGLTIAYMLKLYICLFIEKNQDDVLQQKYDGQKKYMTPLSAVSLTVCSFILPVMSILPEYVYSIFGARSASFVAIAPLEHTIHYFSAENLQGAAISLTIGLCVYFLIVRRVMIRNDVYLNLWPEKLDLEDAVYRPLLDWLTRFSHMVTKLIADLPEFIILLLRGTVFRKKNLHIRPVVGNRMTYALGMRMNSISDLVNHHTEQEKEWPTDWEVRLGEKFDRFVSFFDRTTNSVSFALLLVSGALLAMLLYLILH